MYAVISLAKISPSPLSILFCDWLCNEPYLCSSFPTQFFLIMSVQSLSNVGLDLIFLPHFHEVEYIFLKKVCDTISVNHSYSSISACPVFSSLLLKKRSHCTEQTLKLSLFNVATIIYIYIFSKLIALNFSLLILSKTTWWMYTHGVDVALNNLNPFTTRRYQPWFSLSVSQQRYIIQYGELGIW